MSHAPNPSAAPGNFIGDIVRRDVAAGKWDGKVVTRFPPEPNGYLHIGHAFAASVSYHIASAFGGRFHLRFDDTNPTKENREFVDAIQADLKWLGLDWGQQLYHAADYFEQMYNFAVTLIEQGKAYVCELSIDDIRAFRGNFTTPGKNSPFRDRSIKENLALFAAMRAGELADGKAVLRAKIDMQAPNLNMRDPVMYRIYHHTHYRAGDRWCIYPMYDWAHCLEDSLEGVTHSLCSLEFENHRPLYDWYLDQLGIHHPQQIEFSRLNISHTVLGKRKLAQLIAQGLVSGWDDPRMPTLAGMRRRGYPAAAILGFLGQLGVSKAPAAVDISLLEYHVRETLNASAPRVMAVLEPLEVVIDNWPDGKVEQLDADNNPADATAGTRKVPFGKRLYIERADFMLEPPKKYFRLAPGKEVRLKHAYYLRYVSHQVDDDGQVIKVHCRYDPQSRGGQSPDGRKVRGTLHWVSAAHAIDAEVRLFDRLFCKADPENTAAGESFTDFVHPTSKRVLTGCKLEPSLQSHNGPVQFMRQGYFSLDAPDSKAGALVFNQTVPLKDSWAKKRKQPARNNSAPAAVHKRTHKSVKSTPTS